MIKPQNSENEKFDEGINSPEKTQNSKSQGYGNVILSLLLSVRLSP